MRITASVLPDPGDAAGLDGLIDSVQAASDAGFPAVWLPQLPPMAGAAGWDALTSLAVAGALVPSIDLGTGVTVAYGQHPLVLARQALTASAAAGGRLTLGLGVSHRFLVTDMLGYSYEAPVEFLREYLSVLQPALAGRPVEHHGHRITAVGQLALPKAPTPGIVLAALGPRMLRLAGELADGTITAWTGPKALERQIVPGITAAAEAAGRPAPQVIAGVPVCVTDDVDAARAAISASVSYGDLPAYRAVLDLEGVDSVADVCVFGDEQDVIAGVRRFADAGATEFSVLPVGDAATQARTLELLAAI
jgi:F420-dependent oxidoreductase-like protein